MPETLNTPHSSDLPSGARIDWAVFAPSLLLVLAAGIYLTGFPEQAEATARAAMNFVTSQFGWLFVLTGGGAFVFALWLAFGRYGQVKLGKAGDGVEFAEIPWAAMMFSAGIGIGLVSWAFVEPIYYLSTPPLGVEAHSSAAVEWAHMYGQFHWGFIPWALYAIPAVPVAYMLYVKDRHALRISEACAPVLNSPARRRWKPVIDTLVIIGLIGGAGTSLGLGVPLVSAFVGELLGIPDNLLTRFGVLAFWTLLFGASVYRGLHKGISVLSDINIGLAMAILLFILFAGPTVFILSLSANSLGLMLDNFTRMSFWLDPVERGGFPEAWTLFYWAWWVSYAPMMGLFFGRISRGRTIRHLVLGVIGWGSLGCCSFLAICGGYALDLELSGALPVVERLAGQGISATVVDIVRQMPLGGLMIAVYTFLSFIFLATTLDSAAYVLASISTHDLRGDQEPSRRNRLTWAFALAFIAVGLLVVGGLKTVQSLTIITALPLIPVLLLLAVALLRWLRQDFGGAVKKPVLVLPADAPARDD
ncbi:BCCT family transporter [Parahaliea mediterranea]|uniref:BCCT family transporter n=1 Tax=Parahaliea mediterranea TaxID=651086 RepID=A0A939DEA9_9GAMM|nr:BCCT family transporter [Parahaliea mediterranea]MBN7796534.1 BCCT family transporter [Parahaliea mediterranea]